MGLYSDRVYETTTTTGTGTITLAGAVAGFTTFTSQYAVGDEFSYLIERGAEWEIGIGQLLTSTTLERKAENVLRSSNADALVSFSAGTKKVLVTLNGMSVADMGITIALAARMVAR